MKGNSGRLFKGIMLLSLVFLFLGGKQPLINESFAEEGTFEAYGNSFSSTEYDHNNYITSAALREVMPVFEAITRAIQKRDLGSYKKYVAREIIQMIDEKAMSLTSASPVDIILNKGWEGNGVVLLNVTLKYKNKADAERDPIFIKENGAWKLNAGIGLER